MDYDELRVTTMDPTERTLLQVTLDECRSRRRDLLDPHG
jgi:DNA gyrase/topoisomerase IV subunit B